MENLVLTSDFANGECPYGGCEYNDEGYCVTENINFLWDKIERIYRDSLKENFDNYFNCEEQDVKPCTCEYCGTFLIRVKQIHDREKGHKYERICPNEC